MKAWTLAATCVLWAAMVATVTADIPTLRYVVSRDGDSYTEFLRALRKQLATGGIRYGIPVLPDPSTVPDSDRYIYLELQSSETEAAIILAQDVTTSALVAYEAKGESFFFDNAPPSAINVLFPDTEKSKLPYTSNYVEVARIAEVLREKVDLGPSELSKAVTDIYDSAEIKTRLESLIVILEMIFGAARFRYLEHIAHRAFLSGQSTQADLVIQVLEDNWDALSEAIQKSNQGLFPTSVRLWRANFSPFRVDSLISPIISNLAFMPFVCKERLTASTLKISPISLRRIAAEDTECLPCKTIPEPTLQISGLNGLCANARNALSFNTPVLRPCASDADVYQLWTFKRDGTIRSKFNGGCLTITGNIINGAHVVVESCETANPKTIYWKLNEDGTIINRNYQLVLTSLLSAHHSSLVVYQQNSFIPAQAWLASNNTEPFVTTIIDYSEMCLETDKEGSVRTAECEIEKKSQQWALFSDGTIRAELDEYKKTCITCEHLTDEVVTRPCKNQDARQRFFFRKNSIWNSVERVMEVNHILDRSRPKIICAPYAGTTNQQWLATF